MFKSTPKDEQFEKACLEVNWSEKESKLAFRKLFFRFPDPPFSKLISILAQKLQDTEPAFMEDLVEELRLFLSKLDASYAAKELTKQVREGSRTEYQLIKRILSRARLRNLCLSLINLLLHTKGEYLAEISKLLAFMNSPKIFEYALREYEKQNESGKRLMLEVMFKLDVLKTMPYLESHIKNGNTNEKIHAVNLAAHSKSIITANIVGKALDDENWSVRYAAVMALGKIALPEGFALLKKVINDREVNIRERALELLGYWGAPGAVELLVGYLNDPKPHLVKRAIRTLGVVGNDSVIPYFLVKLGEDDETFHNDIKASIRNLLFKQCIDPVGLYIKILANSSEKIRKLTNEFQEAIEAPMFEDRLLEHFRRLDYLTLDRFIHTIIDIAPDKFSKVAAKMLNENDAILKRYGIELILAANGQRYSHLLYPLANSGDWLTRELAIEALGKLKDRNAIALLSDIFKNEPQFRSVAAKALGQIGEPETVKLLETFLISEKRHTKLEIVKAIGAMWEHAEQAAPSLVASLKSPDKELRTEILDILVKITPEKFLNDKNNPHDSTIMRMGRIDSLLTAANKEGASEVFIIEGQVPKMRIQEELVEMGSPTISGKLLDIFFEENLTPEQVSNFKERNFIELAYESRKGERYLISGLRHLHGTSLTFRRLQDRIPSLEELGLPPLIKRFASLPRGMVIVAGSGRSGKTTTLAAMVDIINTTRSANIIILENPIEIIHRNRRSIISQRQIGMHTSTYAGALRAALREDPDVILVGEIKDFETAYWAITAAETGHLVLATLSTVDAANTVERLVNFYPGAQQRQIRTILSDLIKGVICQQLVKRKDRKGRIAACEVMSVTPAIANLIRSNKANQIPSVIQSSTELGMQTMDQALLELYKKGIISGGEAYLRSVAKADFESYLKDEELDELFVDQERD